MPWRPVWLWGGEAPTVSRQSAHRWRWGCQSWWLVVNQWCKILQIILFRGRVAWNSSLYSQEWKRNDNVLSLYSGWTRFACRLSCWWFWLNFIIREFEASCDCLLSHRYSRSLFPSNSMFCNMRSWYDVIKYHRIPSYFCCKLFAKHNIKCSFVTCSEKWLA
jgi:hypothetical protein